MAVATAAVKAVGWEFVCLFVPPLLITGCLPQPIDASLHCFSRLFTCYIYLQGQYSLQFSQAIKVDQLFYPKIT